MKKIVLLLLAVLFGMSLTLYAGAEETADPAYADNETETEAPSYTDNAADIRAEDTKEDSASTYHTVFTRLWEFFYKYKAEILGVVGDAAIFIIAIIIKIRNASSAKAFAADISETNTSQRSVVNVVNEMVDGYNAMKRSYDEYGVTENDRNRVVGTMVATNTAILEILATVYANSKNLPQGVKDIVSLKYANCLRTLENDEQMMAIVSAVRENIGAGIKVEETEDTDTSEEEEESEDSEV